MAFFKSEGPKDQDQIFIRFTEVENPDDITEGYSDRKSIVFQDAFFVYHQKQISYRDIKTIQPIEEKTIEIRIEDHPTITIHFESEERCKLVFDYINNYDTAEYVAPEESDNKERLEASGKELYYNSIKKDLKPKDGNIHVLMINSFSRFLNQFFNVEHKYTAQIGAIVDAMQDDGYEIVDIKFNSLKGQGVFDIMEGFHTLVMYG